MAERRGGPTKPASSDVSPEHLHLWQIQAVRDLLVILLFVLIVWAGYAMRSVTVPLLVALLLAYLFEPLVARLSERERLSRPWVVGGLLLAVGVTFIAVVGITVPLLVSQTLQLIEDVREGRFAEPVMQLREYVPQDYQDEFDRFANFFTPVDITFDPDVTDEQANRESLQEDGEAPQPDGAADDALSPAVARELDMLREELEALRDRIDGEPVEVVGEGGIGATGLMEFARRSASVVITVIGEIIAIGLLAFLIPFYFFFFSVWYPSVVRFVRDLIPPNRRERTLFLLGKMDRAVAGFVRGRLLIAIIMGIMLAVGWQLVGVQYAIVLGFVIGFFSIVPYLGGVGIPAAIGLLWLGQAGQPEEEQMAWYMIIFWPTLVFTIVQIIESYFLTPMIQGKATNLDPVTILVAVLAGGAIMGVYGMLLAIPLTACLKIVLAEVLMPRIKMWSTGQAHDPLPIERD